MNPRPHRIPKPTARFALGRRVLLALALLGFSCHLIGDYPQFNFAEPTGGGGAVVGGTGGTAGASSGGLGGSPVGGTGGSGLGGYGGAGGGTGGVTAVVAGVHHTCALRADGSVLCWGGNFGGALGPNGAGGYNTEPVTVDGLTDAIAIAAGFDYNCVIHTDRSVSCWGDNTLGQLGSGGVGSSSATPIPVAGLADASAITAANGFSCALLTNGTVYCWGYNGYGALGTAGASSGTPVPNQVDGLTDVGAVSAGHAGQHNCALRDSDDTVRCWGRNAFGQLGTGGTGGYSTTPMTVTGLTGAAAIGAGANHTCAAVTSLGEVFCWGSNNHGTLGIGGAGGYEGFSVAPVLIDGLSDAVAVSAGAYHNCVIRNVGAPTEVVCWGRNDSGQLGRGTFSAPSVALVPVVNLTNAKTISAGYGHSCASLYDGSVRCWGSNHHGQLGDSSVNNSNVPVAPTGL